jgi:UPF0716 protein FxsA
MFGRLLILFIVVPFIELYLLIKLGQIIDVWPTLGIIILTGVLGANLVKRQGRAVLLQLNQQLAAGQIPAEPLVDGALILVSGVLLITPGLITDTTGLLMLLPPVRAFLRNKLLGGLKAQLSNQVQGMMGGNPGKAQAPFGFGFGGFGGGFGRGASPGRPADGDVIDIEPDQAAPPRPAAPVIKSLPR